MSSGPVTRQISVVDRRANGAISQLQRLEQRLIIDLGRGVKPARQFPELAASHAIPNGISNGSFGIGITVAVRRFSTDLASESCFHVLNDLHNCALKH